MDESLGASSSPGPVPALELRPAQRSRYRGCLLGGAAGDALGAAVEHDPLVEIERRHGPGGIRDLAPCFGRLGAITADTQLNLFTAEGLIRAAIRETKGGAERNAVLHRAYLRWLKTQGEAAPIEVPMDGWLCSLRPLWSRRGPGITCQSALRSLEVPGTPAKNTSRGCGAVTRIAPVGLVTAPGNAFEVGEELAALTHGHRSAHLTAGVLSVLIARLVQGETLPAALQGVRQTLQAKAEHQEVLAALDQAESLAASRAPPRAAAVEALGGGWVATEALAIALYCVLATSSFEQAVILSVNHSGDSDSTGALAGSLAGTLYGAEAIPARWTLDLELRPEITALADDLYALASGKLDLHSQETLARYPAS